MQCVLSPIFSATYFPISHSFCVMLILALRGSITDVVIVIVVVVVIVVEVLVVVVVVHCCC